MVFKQYIQLFVFLCLFFSNNSFTQTVKNEFVVVVDAGHGGKDPGNRGNGYFEKNISLNIALNVGEILTKNKVKVVYTRTKDVFVDLFKRAEIANNSNADLTSSDADLKSIKSKGKIFIFSGLKQLDLT